MKTLALFPLLALASAAPSLAQIDFQLDPTIDPVFAWIDQSYEVADYDGDGDLDLIVPRRGFPDYRVELHERLPGGGLAPPVVLVAEPEAVAGGYPTMLHVTDIDGDGRTDVIVASENGSVLLHRGLPGGGLAPSETLRPEDTRVWSIATGDVDGDGDRDIVLFDDLASLLLLYRQQPGGGFTTEIIPTTAQRSRGIALEDFDGDGALDLLLLSHFAGEVLLFPGAGGSFPQQFVVSSAISGPERLAVADMNGDGTLDVVVTGLTFGQVVLLENSAGSWTATALEPASAVSPRAVAIADLNGDGILDVAVDQGLGSGPSAEPMRTYERLADGTVRIQDHSFHASSGTKSFRFLDYDGDGDTDMVYFDYLNERIRHYTQETDLGASSCAPVANSTDAPATLLVSGSPYVDTNRLSLTVMDLPPLSFGMFAAATAVGPGFTPAGGDGLLCLGQPNGGGIGRFDRPGEILRADASGTLRLLPDLHDLPTPGGRIVGLAGQTWSFQLWYRDVVAGLPTFNFSEGKSVLLR